MVIVDTEEEFDWSKPFNRSSRGTQSVTAQPRAHDIFSALGVVPTYVMNHAVATSAQVGTLRTLVESGQAEFGTHCHPWITPPHDEEVNVFNSFHGNLPRDLEAAKLRATTEAVAQAMGSAPMVFKAGRYGLGPNTFDELRRLGYLVDCSFVPATTFARYHGPDFVGTPDQPFFTDSTRTLLEVPLTVGYGGWARSLARYAPHLWDSPHLQRLRVQGVLSRMGALWRARLSPEGFDAPSQVRLLDALFRDGRRCFTLSYHSPSLQPGHTPYVRDPAELREFLKRIDTVLRHFRDNLGGAFTTPLQLRKSTEAVTTRRW